MEKSSLKNNQYLIHWIGTTLERSFKFLNDHLELKAVGKEERIDYTLKWKRL